MGVLSFFFFCDSHKSTTFALSFFYRMPSMPPVQRACLVPLSYSLQLLTIHCIHQPRASEFVWLAPTTSPHCAVLGQSSCPREAGKSSLFLFLFHFFHVNALKKAIILLGYLLILFLKHVSTKDLLTKIQNVTTNWITLMDSFLLGFLFRPAFIIILGRCHGLFLFGNLLFHNLYALCTTLIIIVVVVVI